MPYNSFKSLPFVLVVLILVAGGAATATEFEDNGDGSIFDPARSLTWLKNANCNSVKFSCGSGELQGVGPGDCKSACESTSFCEALDLGRRIAERSNTNSGAPVSEGEALESQRKALGWRAPTKAELEGFLADLMPLATSNAPFQKITRADHVPEMSVTLEELFAEKAPSHYGYYLSVDGGDPSAYCLIRDGNAESPECDLGEEHFCPEGSHPAKTFYLHIWSVRDGR